MAEHGESGAIPKVKKNKNKKKTNPITIDNDRLDLQSDPNFRQQETMELIEKLNKTTINQHLDEVLDAVHELDTVCDERKCKIKTNLIGNDCRVCKKRYCIKHQLPEVHGCAEAVKRMEREEFLKAPTKKQQLKDEDKVKAKAKLESKLKEMNRARKSKPQK